MGNVNQWSSRKNLGIKHERTLLLGQALNFAGPAPYSGIGGGFLDHTAKLGLWKTKIGEK